MTETRGWEEEVQQRQAGSVRSTEADEEEEEEEERQQPEQARSTAFKFIEINGVSACQFKKFYILRREASIRILPPPQGTDIIDYLESALNEIREYAINSGGVNDYVGILFISSDWTRGPASLSFRPARDFTHARNVVMSENK